MLSRGDTDTGSPVFVTWCSVCSQLSSWGLAAWRQMTAAMIVLQKKTVHLASCMIIC